MRQAFAGLLWSKQFYHYVVRDWLDGDPGQPPPPRAPARPQPRLDASLQRRRHLDAGQVGVPVVRGVGSRVPLRPAGAGRLRVRQGAADADAARVVHAPNGQLPAYEWAFGDVNPPVHAWAAWRVYKIEKKRAGARRPRVPRARLPQAAAQLHLVGQPQGRRGQQRLPGRLPRARQHRRLRPQRRRCRPAAISSRPTAPAGWRCTASTCSRSRWSWPRDDPAYEDVASKFWEHFLYIAHAMNHHRRRAAMRLWDEEDGFFYDVLHLPDGQRQPLKVRSMVGLIPLFAVETLEPECSSGCPVQAAAGVVHRESAGSHAQRRVHEDAAAASSAGCCRSSWPRPAAPRAAASCSTRTSSSRRTASARCRAGIATHPYVLRVNGKEHRVDYEPAESTHRPVRRQLELARADLVSGQLPADRIAAEVPPLLRRRLQGRVPDRFGQHADLWEVAAELSRRLTRIFLRDAIGPAAGARRQRRCFNAIRTGATSCCSTNTSTATTAPASAPAIRPAGRRWSPS